jgi:hypothetical protein
MALCMRCGHYRPGVNDRGMCPSCERFVAPSSVSPDKMQELLSKFGKKGLKSPVLLDTPPTVREPYTSGLWPCPKCKQQLATEQDSPCYQCVRADRYFRERGNDIVCQNCEGKGYIRRYQHVEKGKCFKCCGLGRIYVPPQAPVSGHTRCAYCAKWVQDGQTHMCYRPITLPSPGSETVAEKLVRWAENGYQHVTVPPLTLS